MHTTQLWVKKSRKILRTLRLEYRLHRNRRKCVKRVCVCGMFHATRSYTNNIQHIFFPFSTVYDQYITHPKVRHIRESLAPPPTQTMWDTYDIRTHCTRNAFNIYHSRNSRTILHKVHKVIQNKYEWEKIREIQVCVCVLRETAK